MRAHFRHLRFKSFSMIQRTPQAIEFWPFKSLSEVSGVHRDSISQSGSCLGSVSVHSLTLPHTFLHSREYVMWLLGFLLAHTFALPLPWLTGFLPLGLTPGLPLGSHPCKPFALVASPRLGSQHNLSVKFISKILSTCQSFQIVRGIV